MLKKEQFIEALAGKQGITKKQAKENVEAFLDTLVDSLDHNGVNFTGHFTVEVKDTKERNGRNPATGADILIPAGKRVSLKAKARLNNTVK